MAIWSGNPEVVQEQGEYVWDNCGEAVPFTVSYDLPTGQVTFDLDDKELQWTYDPDKAFDYIAIVAKGNAGGDMYLTDMTMNGNTISDVQSIANYQGLVVKMTDAEQTNGFTLTGNAMICYTSKTTQEIPGFHVFAMSTHDISVPEFATLALPVAMIL